MWQDENLPERNLPSNNIITSTSPPRTLEEHLIRDFGWARAKAAADDAWRSAAAEAVDLGIRKALLVCQDELDDAASDAWGTVTWRPLLYLADAVGIEEEFIGSVRSYVLGTRPALERGGNVPVELKEAKLEAKLPVDQGKDVSWTTLLEWFTFFFFLVLISPPLNHYGPWGPLS